MIYFRDWTIRPDGEVIAQQYDNLTRSLMVAGDLPDGWDWSMLVLVEEAMDILPLSPVEGGVSIDLTANQLAFSGYYQMQLKATKGDLVKHSNVITVFIPKSLSGDEQWPTIPSEFTELEQRVNAGADRAEAAKDKAEDAAKRAETSAAGNYYSPEVSQPTDDTMLVSYTPSAAGMPSVPAVSVTLPAGPVGAKGEKGDTGAQGPQGVQGERGETGAQGPRGEKGEKGETGAQGPAGSNGQDGQNGKDGAPGADGAPGVSCTHSWNGTTLTVTSASGTSSANLKGEKGEQGAPGKDGADGAKGDTGPQGPQGEQGPKGDPGEPGPAGKDGAPGPAYELTEDDKQEMVNLVLAALPNGDEVSY